MAIDIEKQAKCGEISLWAYGNYKSKCGVPPDFFNKILKEQVEGYFINLLIDLRHYSMQRGFNFDVLDHIAKNNFDNEVFLKKLGEIEESLRR